MDSKFLKVADKVAFRPNVSGLDYELEPQRVYKINVDKYTDEITLEFTSDLKLPEKMYSTENEDKFVKKVLNHFNTSPSGVTGVMFSGVKGTGKTVTAKRIALESNLPIILIDKGFRPSLFSKLFNKLGDTKFCMIFDEVDKLGDNYDDTYLLTILDGINSTGKSLMLFTCNNENAVNENLIDRCSRIRYWKKFKEMSKEMVSSVLTNRCKDKTEVKPLTEFIFSNFGCISYDNVCSFVDEINNNPNEQYEELFEDMNLSTK